MAWHWQWQVTTTYNKCERGRQRRGALKSDALFLVRVINGPPTEPGTTRRARTDGRTDGPANQLSQTDHIRSDMRRPECNFLNGKFFFNRKFSFHSANCLIFCLPGLANWPTPANRKMLFKSKNFFRIGKLLGLKNCTARCSGVQLLVQFVVQLCSRATNISAQLLEMRAGAAPQNE